MRLSPPLAVGGLLVAAVAGLAVWHRAEPMTVASAPPVPLGGPLVALPWDAVVARRFDSVAVEVPRGWIAGGGPAVAGLAVGDDPEAALTARLSADCARPVVLRWRDQWRGECRSRSGTRVRGAVIRAGGGWAGVEARYPDRLDARLAPRVARMLASLRPAG